MNQNIEVLEEVLDVLEEEKRKLYNLVNQNEFRIEEINSYLREISKKEDEDFKVFSPRNAENIHREQIEEDTSEMKRYQDENAEYHKKIDALKALIDKVNIVIGNLQDFNNNEKKISESEDYGHDIENFIVEEMEDNGENAVENNRKNDVEHCNEDTENQINNNMDRSETVENMNIENNLEKKHIAHQILNCVSFIIPDAERARIELTALSKKLIE